jgi:hypothetical protein
MNLPLVLDIAVGLIFVFLILSLLTSEIQELIATISQWRAKHLKSSIDVLLAGGSEVDTPERDRAIQLANQLYNNPLINTLNQEYKQIDPGTDETSSQNQDKKPRKIFGRRRSGPSYIPSETFATTLVETLKIPELIHKASEPRLIKLKEKLIEYITSLLDSLNSEQEIKQDLTKALNELSLSYEEVVREFQSNKATLNGSLSRMSKQLDGYIADAEAILSDNATSKLFLRKIKSLREDAFDTTNNSILLGGLQPTLPEVLEDLKSLRDYSIAIREGIPTKDSETYKRIQDVYGDVKDIVEKSAIEKLPDSAIQSLSVLATRAQNKINNVEEGMNQFQKEVETWFDRSMDRASGVYKRNAKGVALLIGLLVAIFTNADTFHIASRLSKDSELRSIISNRVSEVKPINNLGMTKEEIRSIEKNLLDEVSVPLGWNPANLEQQYREEWSFYGWRIPFLKRIFGWILSAIALAMGAPFWFDLLGRVINVRNSGPKPVSYNQDRPPSK